MYHSTLPLKRIIIEDKNRWRQEFDEDALNQLSDSIETLGLLHAPVVKNDGLTLIAGERRFRAVKALASLGKTIRYNGRGVQLGHIPVIRMDDLTERAYKEAELHENIIREDYTWQERAHAVTELHKLREEQAAEKGEKHTKVDTAREIENTPKDQRPPSRTTAEIREDLLVSAYMDDAEVRNAPNRKEAFKIVKRKLEQAHRAALAREFDMEKLRTPHKALHGDLFEILPKLPAHEYDCIIADPPYGIDAGEFKNQSAVQHSYQDSEETSNTILAIIAREGMRVTKFKAHAYIFCDILRFPIVKKIFETYEWYVWRTPLIWYKGSNVGVAPRPDHGPRRTYEAILYAIKNDRKVAGIWPDVLEDKHDKSIQYGAHKPPALYSNLIKRTCLPGDKVLDPCCGTGPIFIAAEGNRVVATGIEIGEEGFGYCVARIKHMIGRE